MSYYAVANGRNPGIYSTWDQCKAQVDGYSGAKYKKFKIEDEALDFIKSFGDGSFKGKSTSNSNYSGDSKGSGQPRKYFSKLTSKKRINDDDDSNDLPPAKRHRLNSHQIPSSSKDKDRVHIYTDGACSNNGSGAAKAGVGVYFGDNHPLNVSRPVKGRVTNNCAEIEAVTEAAEIAKRNGMNKIAIYTDSQFLIKCHTLWMEKWKKNNWITSGGSAVKNKDELIKMDNALMGLDFQFKYVPGHAGIPGNEKADRLARSGAQKYTRRI